MTLQLEIKDGKFINYYGRYVSEFTPTYVNGNGWEATIRGKKVICHAEREYSTGRAVQHRVFKLEDGIIGLSGGDIRDAYAYFRSEKFQNFLNDLGIDAVKHQDPNSDFMGYAAYPDAYIKVKTDGEATSSLERDRICDTAYWETWTISGASWAIVHKHNYCRDHRNDSCILYTLIKDVTSLYDEIKASDFAF